MYRRGVHASPDVAVLRSLVSTPSARFRSGLAVGKFAPPHRGHQLLIDTALAECDDVTVLCYSKPDFPNMPSALRAEWLRLLHPRAHVFVPADPPPDDADGPTHRVFVRDWLAAHGIVVDVVYTSEEYGAEFSRVLGVPHRCVDQAREIVPVSGTAVRQDPGAQRRFMDPVVFRAALPHLPRSNLPETMRAVLRTDGGITVARVPVPTLAPGEVLVRVVVAGVCRTDVAAARGPFRAQMVLGHEASGWVAATGEGVDRGLMGAVVAIDPRVGGGFLGVDRNGAYAEFVAVGADRVVRLPPSLPWRKGAYVEPVAAALAIAAALDPGERTLVLGSGRIARLLCRVLEARGFASVTAATQVSADADFGAVVACDPGGDALLVAAGAARPGGTVVVRRRPGEAPQPEVSGGRQVRVVEYGDFAEAAAMLSRGLAVDDMLGEVHTFEAADRALDCPEEKKVYLAPDPECVD